MKTIVDVSYRKARVMALYLVLFLFVDFAQAQDITWKQTNCSFGSSIQCFAQNGSTLFAGTLVGGVYRSMDNGTTWQAVNNGLTNTSVQSLAVRGTSLFAGTEDGIFRSLDNGTTWVNTGFKETKVYSLTFIGTRLFAGLNDGMLFYSLDNGTTWARNGLTRTIVRYLTVRGSTLFAGTSNGVYRSSDYGTTWQSVGSGIYIPFVNSLASIGTTLFAASGGVYRSSDNGETWIRSGLMGIDISSFAVIDTTLFAGTWGGVYRSSDNGTTWQAVNSGLANSVVQSLAVIGSTLFVGTADGVVFKADTSSTSPAFSCTSAPQPASVTISFAPHPVLDRTRLTLDIPRAGMVEVSIFDVLGRLVQHGALGELAAGAHDVEQDLHTLPNGTYSVVVQAGSERAHKLLQVLR